MYTRQFSGWFTTHFTCKKINKQDVILSKPALSKDEGKDDSEPKLSLRQAQTDKHTSPKAKLKANKADGLIEIDSYTTLENTPPIAWEYKLGNRSALEWILDQYKEKKPSDPTIAEKFNTYKFSDYKEKVIDLLKRVCTVSVVTMKIVGEMPEE